MCYLFSKFPLLSAPFDRIVKSFTFRPKKADTFGSVGILFDAFFLYGEMLEKKFFTHLTAVADDFFIFHFFIFWKCERKSYLSFFTFFLTLYFFDFFFEKIYFWISFFFDFVTPQLFVWIRFTRYLFFEYIFFEFNFAFCLVASGRVKYECIV